MHGKPTVRGWDHEAEFNGGGERIIPGAQGQEMTSRDFTRARKREHEKALLQRKK